MTEMDSSYDEEDTLVVEQGSRHCELEVTGSHNPSTSQRAGNCPCTNEDEPSEQLLDLLLDLQGDFSELDRG